MHCGDEARQESDDMTDFNNIRAAKRLATEALQKVDDCDQKNDAYGPQLDDAKRGLDAAIGNLDVAMNRAPRATGLGAIMSAAEMLEALDEPMPDAWGPWRFNRDNLTLEFWPADRKDWLWYVDLERCKTHADVLEWVFSFTVKEYGQGADPTPDKSIADLTRALLDILFAGNPNGQPDQHRDRLLRSKRY